MVNMICDATPVGSVEEMKLAKRATLGRPKPPEWRKRVSAILADQSHGGEGGERAHSGKTNRTQRGGTRRVAGDFGRTNRTQMGEVPSGGPFRRNKPTEVKEAFWQTKATG